MFDIQGFMGGLDQIYQEGRIDQVEDYLLGGLKTAGEQNKEANLVILNDLMGYYRAVSRHQDMQSCADRVLQLIDDLGLGGTVNHGTTLLNVATGYRAAGRYADAEAYYRQAEGIFQDKLEGPDYRMATLHNNLALLYSQTGRPEDAKARILQALALTEQMPDMEIEQAITYTNLGNVCFNLNQTHEAAEDMEKAVALFEKNPDHLDPHYPAALSGLGAACFHEGKLHEAAAYYQKSMDIIEQLYGKNDDWETTRQNLEIVNELVQRRDAMAAKNMKGLELARAYYEEVGKPILQEKYPQYISRIAAGLVGEGSECLGFDDEQSTDHDFGPGFCLWLTNEDYQAIGAALQADYDALPEKWKGFPVRNTTTEGAGRVGVLNMDDFYRNFTGYAQAPAAKTAEDLLAWTKIQPEMLRTATNGEVFSDELGEFSRRREAFAHYPRVARLYRLADALHRMAQAGQYNYGRGRKRGDLGMMYSSLAEFIQAAAETGYLLNDSYMPFYKWRIRGMEAFTRLPQWKPLLEELMAAPANQNNVEDKIEALCALAVKELHAQKLSDSEDSFLDSHQFAVLRLAQRLLNRDSGLPLPDLTPAKKALVEQVVTTEWNQFQQVQNEGGRASCQNNWPTFQIMRKSQFYTWDDASLESYLGDLQEGDSLGWNLVMEKYARMMEHTSPEQYRQFADKIPTLDPQRVQLQEQLIAITMNWNSEMQQKYPFLMHQGRNQFSAADSEWDTSSETYLRGELSTYSDATLKLYGQMVLAALRRDDNLVEQTLACTVHFYGYTSLKAADETYQKRNFL